MSCRWCDERRLVIAGDLKTRLRPLCFEHQADQERERPKVTVTLSKESREALRAMKAEDGLSTSRVVDLMIRREWRRRCRLPAEPRRREGSAQALRRPHHA